MRKRLKNLKNKSGHSENGAPRQLIDEATYREHQAAAALGVHFDSEYAGWSWASRPRDQAITIRRGFVGISGASGTTGATGGGGSTPQVNLGTAGNFAILTKTGITTTGGSTVDGDMGISPAAAASITGFALVLDGSGQFSTSSQVHPGTPAPPYPAQLGHVFASDYAVPTPANLTQAVLDMQAAYTAASTLAANHTAAGGDIGGLTLEAGAANGVYKYTGATSVSAGPLTLHGTAPGDTIVVQIAGTFDVHQNVILTGSLAAHPENVFFVVAGQVTIFPGVIVSGEILGQTGIAMQAGAILNGRALAQTNVTLINSTITEV